MACGRAESRDDRAARLAQVIAEEHVGEELLVRHHRRPDVGIHVTWNPPDELVLRLLGDDPPKQKTIRRWCAAFFGDWHLAEWTTEGSVVTCRRRAESQ